VGDLHIQLAQREEAPVTQSGQDAGLDGLDAGLDLGFVFNTGGPPFASAASSNASSQARFSAGVGSVASRRIMRFSR
jgi:hypothetical protein